MRSALWTALWVVVMAFVATMGMWNSVPIRLMQLVAFFGATPLSMKVAFIWLPMD